MRSTTTQVAAGLEPLSAVDEAAPLAISFGFGLGDPVAVRNRFDGDWSDGFEVAGVTLSDGVAGYQVRRVSDGSVLPAVFEPFAVAPAPPSGLRRAA